MAMGKRDIMGRNSFAGCGVANLQVEILNLQKLKHLQSTEKRDVLEVCPAEHFTLVRSLSDSTPQISEVGNPTLTKLIFEK